VAALLLIREAAEALRCSQSQVRLLADAGDLADVRIGQRSRRIVADSVDRLLTGGWEPRAWVRRAERTGG
jgi:excisionase family DNA binding protein